MAAKLIAVALLAMLLLPMWLGIRRVRRLPRRGDKGHDREDG